MAWVCGWGCFDMDCFKIVIKNIALVVCIIAIPLVALTIVLAATTATALVLSLSPHSAWFLAIMVFYVLVGIGTVAGIIECRG